MFGTIHQHLKQYLIQNFSTHYRREGTITMIVRRCTGLHFLFHLSSSIAFLIKRGKIHVEKIEKVNISHSKRWFHFTNRSLRIPHYFVEILTPPQPWSKNDALIGARYIP